MIKSAPAPRGLASIIVLCSGRFEEIRRCIRALAKHSRTPWELLAIINTSNQDLSCYLAGLQDIASVAVTVVPHTGATSDLEPLRQAVGLARGDYILLLASDVVVTDAWLEQLVALADSDPKIGMTGPVSNEAPPSQWVRETLYSDLEEMQQYAAERRRQFRGKWSKTAKLSSACLLIKRQILTEVGGIDESFRAATFEDELALCMRRAGYHLSVALDLFVHRDAPHPGSDEAGPGIHQTPTTPQSNEAMARSNVEIMPASRIGMPAWGIHAGNRRPSSKVFGVGLPRTGTTSLAAAMLDLGFRTCHACFEEALFDIGDAFFDTPVYVDYPDLDQRYPGSKFILTWRDPEAWYTSFSRSLGSYFHRLRTQENLPADSLIDRRCYLQAFGPGEPTKEQLVGRYAEHRRQVESYFQERPGDLLVLDITTTDDPWNDLCQFLRTPHPSFPFPRLNTKSLDYWKQFYHVNKL